jgi:hypothetical protein
MHIFQMKYYSGGYVTSGSLQRDLHCIITSHMPMDPVWSNILAFGLFGLVILVLSRHSKHFALTKEIPPKWPNQRASASSPTQLP